MNVFANTSYFSPYMINYLNSFSDVNASQAAEFIERQYMYACKRSIAVEEPAVKIYVEKQRVKPTPAKSQKVSLVTRKKKSC